jgi:parallel beta-helix repeat protein
MTLLRAIACTALAASFGTASAQTPFPEPDCGRGELYDDGACRDVRDVLSKDGTLYWVDQRTGSNSNPGTEARPWKTISRSTQDNALRPGDAVVIRAGTYREEVRPREGGARSGGVTKYVTFAAYPGETVTVSGADVVNRPGQGYNGWKRQGDGSWRHDWIWPALRSEGKYAADRRRELFVDNGQVLVQQGGETRPSLRNGQFWVDGPDSAPRAVYVKTFNGGNPNDRTIEVGIRKQLFYSYGEGDHQCGGANRGYYRVLGLRFTHATTKRQRMAVCPGNRGSLLQDIEVVWNNAGGIKLSGQDHLVRNVTASYNGIEGIGGTGCDGCTVEYSEIGYNHWKWTQEWNTAHGGGGKWTRTQNTHIRFNRFIGNHGSGFWLDEGNESNHVYGNYFDGNLKQGIMVEKRSNNTRVYNNVVAGTRYFSPIWNGIGISVSASNDNLVAYNTLIRNDGSGVRIAGDNRDDAVRTVVYNNLFVDNLRSRPDGGERLREIQVLGNGPSNGRSGRDRVESHRIDGNAYWYRSGDGSAAYATFMLSPSSTYGGNLYTNSLSEWRNAGPGYDPNGMVTNLSLPTVLDPTDVEDGWRVGAGSQYNGRAVALPGGVSPVRVDFFGADRPAAGGTVGAHQFGSGPADPPAALAGAIGESGTVTVGQQGPDDWRRVTFAQPLVDPVVVVGPPSYEGADPATARVRNVTPTGFEVQIDEWDYLDGGHVEETVSYLAVEAGAHVLADGTRLVAGRVGRADHDWRSVSYGAPFDAAPVVLVQVSSDEGPSAVAPRIESVTAAGFRLSLQEEEANDGRHAEEVVGYVAVEPTQNVSGGVRAGRGTGVTDRTSRIAYGGSFSTVPTVFATMQTTEGADPAALRYTASARDGVTVFVEEERSADSEVVHAPETVGFLALAPGPLAGQPLAEAAAAPALAAMTSAPAYELGAAAPNPSAGRAAIRYALAEAGPVRLEVYDAIGRRVAVLADGQQEAGRHEVTFDGSDLPSGIYVYRLQAGSFAETRRMTIAR